MTEVCVKNLVSLWGGDPGSTELVRDMINVVYRYRESDRVRYLRISRYWQPRKIIAAADYLRYLYEQGAPVCEPVASRNGHFVELVELQGAHYVCRVTAEAKGRALTHRCTDPVIFEAWGRALGELHGVAASYEPAPELYFHSASKELADTEAWLPTEDHVAQRELERTKAALEAWDGDGGFGITHADCNAGNMIWDGHAISVIDFDEPMRHWFASDVARPFREIEDRPLAQRRALMSSFVRGYRERRALSDSAVASLPLFIQMKNLAMYAWELGSCGTPHDARELVEMRARFANPTPW